MFIVSTVGTGVVASLAQPGGNVTGSSSQTSDTAGKRLELLREVVCSGLREANTIIAISHVGNESLYSAAARPLGRSRRARSSARYLVTSTSQATQKIIMEHSGALFDIDETCDTLSF